MILLNSTIKGKREETTASKWKKEAKHFQNFPFFFSLSSHPTRETQPRFQCPVEEGVKPIPARIFCLRLTGPPCRLPSPGSIDSLVIKVSTRGTNTTPDGAHMIRWNPLTAFIQASPGSLFPFPADPQVFLLFQIKVLPRLVHEQTQVTAYWPSVTERQKQSVRRMARFLPPGFGRS